MNKSLILRISLIVIFIFLILTLCYRIYQLQNIQKDLRPLSELEKQRIIEILNVELNTADYEVIFGNVFETGNETFVQVKLKKENLQKSYLINLNNENLVRDYHENEQ